MKRSTSRSFEWVYFLTVALLFLAVALRTLLLYDQIPFVINRDVALLAAWLIIFLGEPAITRRQPRFFPIYLFIQTVIVVLLLFYNPDSPDYFAILFTLLSLRILKQLDPRPAALWIAAFTPLTVLTLIHTTGLLNALAFALIYTGANAMAAFFSLTRRRANEAHLRNQAIQVELQQTNLKLQEYSDQLKQLAVARERSQLARELHDSVTQTIFSMTLTTKSALLLLDRDPTQVKMQLDHLVDLSKSALAEMQTLISHLGPQSADRVGLAALLHRHLAERELPDSLSVSLEVEGDQSLAFNEDHALFRIIQEALNNIVKHTQASQVCLHLHLTDPLWIEIKDNGQGFELERVQGQDGIGLSSMRERASEIGWDLRIHTAPGEGTCIRAEKEVSDGRSSQD